jgi:transcription termination factor Rho
MPVLERPELEASPLADLHAIANQVGLDGFRRLRKADLIDAILGEESPPSDPDTVGDAEESDSDDERPRPRRRRAPRSRRAGTSAKADGESEESAPRSRRAGTSAKADSEGEDAEEAEAEKPTASEGSSRRGRGRGSRSAAANGEDAPKPRERGARGDRGESADERADAGARIAEGVVEVLGNGSAFLRVEPPEPSDDDIYISAAQVRRCELVSGDKVSGPVRTPRRSERYPSLVRVDTINGASADTVADGVRYDDLPVAWPSERLALGSSDPTLEAIEWITPLGRGSRAVIVGARNAGKSETLQRLAEALGGVEDLELSVVLTGVRPEEVADWEAGPATPVASLSFAASADSQSQAVERALDAAKRAAARGGHAVVLIDSLDGLHPHAARKALAAARNLREGGSLTVIATATTPFGGETTVIALDAALAAAGRQPILDLLNSSTVKAELLVGADGAKAIAKARVEAIEAAS